MRSESPGVDVTQLRERREALLSRFEAWLDEVLADEPPPAGIAAEILAELAADHDAEHDADASARDGLDGARAHLEAARRASGASWLGRLLGRPRRELLEATDAIEQGYAMTLARVDETLRSLGVAEIECAAERFDPHRMQAVQVQQCTGEDEEDGRVLEVIRPGYERRGQLLRPSQVKVTRRSPGSSATGLC